MEDVPKHGKFIDMLQSHLEQLTLKFRSMEQVISQMSSKVTYDQDFTRTEFRVLRNEVSVVSSIVNNHDITADLDKVEKSIR
jgi:hypothetical protein